LSFVFIAFVVLLQNRSKFLASKDVNFQFQMMQTFSFKRCKLSASKDAKFKLQKMQTFSFKRCKLLASKDAKNLASKDAKFCIQFSHLKTTTPKKINWQTVNTTNITKITHNYRKLYIKKVNVMGRLLLALRPKWKRIFLSSYYNTLNYNTNCNFNIRQKHHANTSHQLTF